MALLLTPGPVPVPDFVMQAISQPVIHHRTPEFEQFYAGLLQRLAYLFQTTQTVGTMMGSGTYGVEAALYSLFRSGEKVLVLNIGKFSERWADYGQLLGLDVINHQKEWGKGITPAELITTVNEHPNLRGVVITHSETSTGVCIDLEEMAFAIKEQLPDCLILVDGITSVGAIPFYLDQWDVDCAITASQKSLMNPAGTICFALSEKGREALHPTHPSDFRNLYNYVQALQQPNYPYTPPVQLLFGIDAALQHIHAQTLPVIWNQTHQASQTFKKGITDLGGEVFGESPSESLTAFRFENQDNEEIRGRLLKDFGYKLSGGQGTLKGNIMRISHMGMADRGSMIKVLEALKAII